MVELAYGTGLENRHRCKSVKGSNPFLSAKDNRKAPLCVHDKTK